MKMFAKGAVCGVLVGVMATFLLAKVSGSPSLAGMSFSEVEVVADGTGGLVLPILRTRLVESGARIGVEGAPKLTVQAIAMIANRSNLEELNILATISTGGAASASETRCYTEWTGCVNSSLSQLFRKLRKS